MVGVIFLDGVYFFVVVFFCVCGIVPCIWDEELMLKLVSCRAFPRWGAKFIRPLKVATMGKQMYDDRGSKLVATDPASWIDEVDI